MGATLSHSPEITGVGTFTRTEVIMPEPVHHDSWSRQVRGIRQPVCQCRPSSRGLELFRSHDLRRPGSRMLKTRLDGGAGTEIVSNCQHVCRRCGAAQIAHSSADRHFRVIRWSKLASPPATLRTFLWSGLRRSTARNSDGSLIFALCAICCSYAVRLSGDLATAVWMSSGNLKNSPLIALLRGPFCSRSRSPAEFHVWPFSCF